MGQTKRSLKIGTWNLDRRWDDRHRALIADQNCDVWLVTEVSPNASVDGYDLHVTEGVMARKQHWAGILSREGIPRTNLPDPHPASATATIDGTTYCSSILPWAGCGSEHPWVGSNLADKTTLTIDALCVKLPTSNLVWGGDWNLSLVGCFVGSKKGRGHLLAALQALHLQVPTADELHQLGTYHAIDHVAVPAHWDIEEVSKVEARCNGASLSDHDAYVVTVNDRMPGRVFPSPTLAVASSQGVRSPWQQKAAKILAEGYVCGSWESKLDRHLRSHFPDLVADLAGDYQWYLVVNTQLAREREQKRKKDGIRQAISDARKQALAELHPQNKPATACPR